MTEVAEGGCLCGAVRYTARGPLRPVVACHCHQCRKITGNFVTATSVARTGLEVSGDVTWFVSSDKAKRGFCGICGSNLFWDSGGPYVSIMAGTLDGDTGLKLAGHIYCSSKGDYYEITDGLPQAAEANPSLTSMVRE
ncbi:MAG: GFA family protein [Pseudomonadota bacterium]